MAGTRVVRNISAGAVAAIAAWSSYSHMVHVALRFGERPEVAYALPVSVDGMLVVASAVMVDDKRRNQRVRPIARLAFIAGVLASVAANVTAAHPSIGARIVAAWPAIALLLVVEMLTGPPVAAAELPPQTAAAQDPPAHVVAATPAAPYKPAELQHPPILVHPGGSRPPADISWQPPASTDLPLATASHEPAGTSAPATGVAGTGAGRSRLPGVGVAARTAESAGKVPPPAVVPQRKPAVARPAIADVPPEHSRWGQAGTRAAEGGGAATGRGGSVELPQRRNTARRYQPAETTRQLARQIIDAEPQLSRTEVAARLGLSARRLREVLATPA